MLSDTEIEHARCVFEDVLRQTAYAPVETVVIAGQMHGLAGPMICGYWEVRPDGSFRRVAAPLLDDLSPGKD